MPEIIPVINEQYAVFTCIQCETESTLDVSYYIDHRLTKIRIICPCGNRYHAYLEFRKSVRKKSGLSGIYKTFHKDEKEKSGSMKVENISWTGLQLRMSHSYYCIRHHDITSDICKQESPNNQFGFERNTFNKGDRIRVEFFLDDPKRSFISRDVIVKWMSDTIAGVNFIKHEAFDPSLRFYLLGLKPA
jgi:hypothetical protein